MIDAGDSSGVELLLRQQLQQAREAGNAGRTVAMLKFLGTFLHRQNKLAEAESCLREVLQLQAQRNESYFPYSVVDLEDLGSVLEAEGKLDEEDALLRSALVAARKYYASEPNRTLAWLAYHLAETDRQRKSLAEARSLAEEAVSLYQSHPDWSAAERGYTLQILGNVLLDSGDPAGAETLCRRALEVQRSAQPAQDDDIAKCLGDLGNILQHENKLAEAEGAFREELAKLPDLSRANDARIASARQNLASILQKEGKTAESQELLRQAAPAQH